VCIRIQYCTGPCVVLVVRALLYYFVC
jgi:hypothetical protein